MNWFWLHPPHPQQLFTGLPRAPIVRLDALQYPCPLCGVSQSGAQGPADGPRFCSLARFEEDL